MLRSTWNMSETDVTEWNVPSSDDEQVICKEGHNQDEGTLGIPLKVLLLYSEIEKKGFIELKVKECRRGIEDRIVEPSALLTDSDSQRMISPADEIKPSKENFGKNPVSAAKSTIDKDKTPEPSAFDYTEEPFAETSHMTRKIPKTERFQRKRVGTLENVISDLKRFRDMNNADNKI